MYEWFWDFISLSWQFFPDFNCILYWKASYFPTELENTLRLFSPPTKPELVECQNSETDAFGELSGKVF